jgi:outer membrane protein OmpA-like peptidoglycan-associated protein
MKNLFIIFFMLYGFATFSQQEVVFGTKNTGLINLKGKIYYISDTTSQIPDNIENQKVEGIIYTSKLDVPIRNFTEGFPGVTDRFEYFGIVYNGILEIAKAGQYTWRLSSDDGSKLWIDNQLVIDNDGVHGESSAEANLVLEKGLHKVKIWYFQGPATEIALQLFVKMPDSETEEIFDLKNFNTSLLSASKKVNTSICDEGIKISLPAKILFDTGKSDVKSGSEESFEALKVFLNMYPDANIQICGHSDAAGNEQENLKLSEERANAVLQKIKSTGISKELKFTTKGFGASQPIAKNTDESGRSQNRRVEIIIKP